MKLARVRPGPWVVIAAAVITATSSLACSGKTSNDVFATAASTSGAGGSLVTSGTGGTMNTAAGTGGNLGLSSGAGGAGGAAGGLPCGTALTGKIRDFKQEHPDFEATVASDPGIVLPDLGSDGKPVYAGQTDNPTTSGQANFDQWYRDVPDVNIGIPLTIDFVDTGGDIFTYDNQAFFPINGQGWGDEGNMVKPHQGIIVHTG